jgi:hypothetical protein
MDRGPDWQLDALRYKRMPGYYATVRADTEQALGVVGERYRVLQNREAFAFVDQFLGPGTH